MWGCGGYVDKRVSNVICGVGTICVITFLILGTPPNEDSSNYKHLMDQFCPKPDSDFSAHGIYKMCADIAQHCLAALHCDPHDDGGNLNALTNCCDYLETERLNAQAAADKWNILAMISWPLVLINTVRAICCSICNRNAPVTASGPTVVITSPTFAQPPTRLTTAQPPISPTRPDEWVTITPENARRLLQFIGFCASVIAHEDARKRAALKMEYARNADLRDCFVKVANLLRMEGEPEVTADSLSDSQFDTVRKTIWEAYQCPIMGTGEVVSKPSSVKNPQGVYIGSPTVVFEEPALQHALALRAAHPTTGERALRQVFPPAQEWKDLNTEVNERLDKILDAVMRAASTGTAESKAHEDEVRIEMPMHSMPFTGTFAQPPLLRDVGDTTPTAC